MNQAIVTGSTGLIGSSLVKNLISKGVHVISISRSDSHIDGVAHFKMPMSEIRSLPSKIEKSSINISDSCVFYNLAWSGASRLTDGSFEEQLLNATYSSIAVSVANDLGCAKFVHAGTMEETFLEAYIDDPEMYGSLTNQANYAIAKIASRDMNLIQAYLDKIDYIHTRISVPLHPSSNSYISSTLKKISNDAHYEPPANSRPFDFISLDDLANAYVAIGLNGLNKKNYYIGYSKPILLKKFFELAQLVHNGADKKIIDQFVNTNTQPGYSIFAPDNSLSGTGFRPSSNLLQLIGAYFK